eukprot:COSAG04_NODE_4609_length_1989_cov_6.982011_2_plen_121_part_00
MLVKDAVVGAAVALASDPQATGTVLKRDGQRVRVDLSESGGPASKWMHVGDLNAVSAEPEAEPAAAEEPDDDDTLLDDLEAEVDGLAAEPAAEPDGARSPRLSAQRDVDSAAPRPLLGRL